MHLNDQLVYLINQNGNPTKMYVIAHYEYKSTNIRLITNNNGDNMN